MSSPKCPECGLVNYPNASTCRKCGAQLLALDGVSGALPPPVDPTAVRPGSGYYAPKPPPPDRPELPDRGLGLTLFVFFLGIFGPIMAIVTLATHYYAIGPYMTQSVLQDEIPWNPFYPALLATIVVDIAVTVFMIGFAVRAAVGLWALWPGALRLAYRYLFASLLHTVLATTIPLAVASQLAASPRAVTTFVVELARGLVFFAGCTLYLKRSSTIRAVYAPGPPTQ